MEELIVILLFIGAIVLFAIFLSNRQDGPPHSQPPGRTTLVEDWHRLMGLIGGLSVALVEYACPLVQHAGMAGTRQGMGFPLRFGFREPFPPT